MKDAVAERLERIETPVAVVDLERIRANADRVVEYCRRHDLAWRPHVKTHKSLRIARIQLEAGASGLTVATPREAEVMAGVTDDLLLAYPPVGGSKLDRLMALPESVDLKVGLDTEDALRGLSRAARGADRTVGVLVELDAGLRRVGVPEPEDAVKLASRARALPGVEYRGLMFYPGHMRVPAEEQDDSLAELGDRLQSFYVALHREDLAPEIVSGGSTPTLRRCHEIPGLTEVRAGTCIYNDRDIVALGAAEPDDLAYTILTTVVSDALPGQVVVDAGSKALSKETFRAGGGGYAVLRDRPEVRLTRLSEEHGVVDVSETDLRPSVGDRLHVVPNHVCVSVNLQDHLVGVDGDTVERIELEGRGRGPYRG